MKTRTAGKAALKEEIKHVLGKLWNLEEEEEMSKIFTREFLGAKSVQ